MASLRTAAPTTASTTAQSSAPAITGGGGGAPGGATSGGPMVMSGGNYADMLKFARCMQLSGPFAPEATTAPSHSCAQTST
ncbi:MAG TPA: hypothetical protein VME20_12835 [Acidimicrobiales bacterium]|nr:hypothetical protein [Acidimicrobiales bacterium]